MVKYSLVSSPRWLDEARTKILCSVVFRHLGDAPVEFCASASDDLPHGREIFQRCKAGEFGPVAQPVVVQETAEDVARKVRALADAYVGGVYGAKRFSYVSYFARVAGKAEADRSDVERADLAVMIAADEWEEAVISRAASYSAALDLGAAMKADAWPTPPAGLAVLVASC